MRGHSKEQLLQPDFNGEDDEKVKKDDDLTNEEL